MTDAHEQRVGRPGAQPTSVGPPRLLTGGSDHPAVTGRASESGKPTPVRDLATPGARRGASPGVESHVEPDVAQATVEVDGMFWTVRVQGRSGGGSAVNAPLLLLGFWKAQPASSPPDRETLVVGRLLADMTEGELAAALAESCNPRDPDRRLGFFAELGGHRRS
jgi:hypothetical protein